MSRPLSDQAKIVLDNIEVLEYSVSRLLDDCVQQILSSKQEDVQLRESLYLRATALRDVIPSLKMILLNADNMRKK